MSKRTEAKSQTLVNLSIHAHKMWKAYAIERFRVSDAMIARLESQVNAGYESGLHTLLQERDGLKEELAALRLNYRALLNRPKSGRNRPKSGKGAA